ncbi:MAG TPA: hypothetical protein VG406_08410 [Isosphaeraceae bacterium]|jgi:hypothetical protein|nr:hypothetical protein [Isosphaeraceae bacterium]
MATLEYFIVCESTSVDAATGRISLFHVIEDLFPDHFPYVLPRVEAVSLWNLEAEDDGKDFQVLLRITPPGLRVADFPMNLSRGRSRYRAVLAVERIPLPQPGTLSFEVLLNGRHQASHTVTVQATGALVAGEDLDESVRGLDSRPTPETPEVL